VRTEEEAGDTEETAVDDDGGGHDAAERAELVEDEYANE